MSAVVGFCLPVHEEFTHSDKLCVLSRLLHPLWGSLMASIASLALTCDVRPLIFVET